MKYAVWLNGEYGPYAIVEAPKNDERAMIIEAVEAFGISSASVTFTDLEGYYIMLKVEYPDEAAQYKDVEDMAMMNGYEYFEEFDRYVY